MMSGDAFEARLREALQQGATAMPDEAYERLRQVDYRPRSSTPGMVLGVAGLAATLAATAGILLSLIGFSGSAQPAFAGWTPLPTQPRAGQRAAAEAACNSRVARSWRQDVALFGEMRRREARAGHPSIHPPPRVGGPWRTILTDTRGPYTLVLLGNGEAEAHCLAGPEPSRISGVDMGGSSGAYVRVGAGRLGGLSLGLTRAGNGKPFKYVSGRTGRGVRAVEVKLASGRRISATVAHGWYLAWWPGTERMAAVQARP